MDRIEGESSESPGAPGNDTSPATPYSPAENHGLRQQAILKRIRCGPVFTQERTEAFRAVAIYGTDQPGMLPRRYRALGPSRRKPGGVRAAIGVKIAVDTKAKGGSVFA